LGDSIIGATALFYDIELVTHNFDDFKSIKALRLHDPVK
jgi:predicted nucleic acid-binding protein